MNLFAISRLSSGAHRVVNPSRTISGDFRQAEQRTSFPSLMRVPEPPECVDSVLW